MTTVVVDTTVLDKIIRESGTKVGDILQKMAQDTEADIKMSFADTSPAPAGGPPGIDTGNLKNSIIAEPDGNDWIVHDGVPYGVHLEYGTENMPARPFMMPAVLRAVKRAPDDLMKIVED